MSLVSTIKDGDWTSARQAVQKLALKLGPFSKPDFADLALSDPSNIYALSHDSFADFVEAEHYNWLDETHDLYTTGKGRFDGGIGIGVDPVGPYLINIVGDSDNPIGIAYDNTGLGDVAHSFFLNGVAKFIFGVDNTYDKFKISIGATLGSNDTLEIDSSGNFAFNSGNFTDVGAITGGAYNGMTVFTGVGGIQLDNAANNHSLLIIGDFDLEAVADGFSLGGGATDWRTLTVTGGDVILNQSLQTTDSPTFANLTAEEGATISTPLSCNGSSINVAEFISTGGHATLLFDAVVGYSASIGLGEGGARVWHFEKDASNHFSFVESGVATRLKIYQGGNVEIGGETLFSNKVKFTQIDGDEYIDSLADGYMDYGATTGHRFNANVDVTGSGKFANIGIGTAPSIISGLYISKTPTDSYQGEIISITAIPASADKSFYGLNSIVRVTTSANANNIIKFIGCGGNIESVVSAYTGTIAEVIAHNSTIVFTGVGGVGPTITNAYGFRLESMVANADADIVNAYGLYLCAITAGSSSNWAIYSVGGASYHAGDIILEDPTNKDVSVGSDDAGYLDIKAPTGIRMNINLDVTGSERVGDGGVTNYLTISNTGVVTLTGTAKRSLTLRAEVDYVSQIASSKPTQITIGIYKGFSFPIWNDGVNADEQLFFRENVPGRWDGASDIIIHLKVCLMGIEDVGDKFQLQWSWEHSPEGEPVPETSNSVPVEITVLENRNAQYDEYLVEFTIDHNIDGAGNEIKIHELLGGRLRRIAASADEVTNEITLLDWHTYYTVDKMFKAPN